MSETRTKNKKLKSNTTSYTQPLLRDMKVECFDPTCWSIWLTIFSFQWMQEWLRRCPVRISVIDCVSVALTTVIWKHRFFFPFFEIFIVLLWFLCWSHFVSNEPLFKIKHSIIRVLVFDCLFMQWSGFFTFRLSIINQESVWQVTWAAQIWLKFKTYGYVLREIDFS